MPRLLLPTSLEQNDPAAHPGQLIMGATLLAFSAVCDPYLDGSARNAGYAAAKEEYEWNKFNRNENSSLDVRHRGDRLIPLVMTEHGAMGAHFKAHI